MVCGIYTIRLTEGVRGDCYVGQSIDIDKRWGSHTEALCRGTHDNRILQAAWCKYGADKFSFEILREIEICPGTKYKLACSERYFMQILQPRYNIAPPMDEVAGVPIYSRGVRGVRKREARAAEQEKQLWLDKLLQKAMAQKNLAGKKLYVRDS